MARVKTGTKARASTTTKARTSPRISHIKMQLRLLLQGMVIISTESMRSIAIGIEKHIISKIELMARDSKGLCHARLSLEVDWDEHKRQLEIGNLLIEIDDENELEIEVDAAMEAFKEVIESRELIASWSVTYGAHVDLKAADDLLGFVRTKPNKWAGKTIKKRYHVKKVKELSVGLELVDDD